MNSFIKEYSPVFQNGSLFGEKVFVVVQNRSIGEWLKLELADHFGVSANLNIVLPENAVRTFIRSFSLGRELLSSKEGDREKAVLFMDNLKIIIYKKLEDLLHTDSPDLGTSGSIYKELENYVKGSGVGEKDFETINSLRLYQLADSIAGLFYYYGMNCQELISSWEKGFPFFSGESDGTLIKHEQWQMALWKELFKDSSPYIHLSSILSSIVEQEDPYDGDSVKVILFGSAFMGDSSLRFFHHLSRFVSIDHFILSPSSSSDAFINPLLKSWGALYEGFNSLMANLVPEDSGRIFRSFQEKNNNSLLGAIQNRMLNDISSTEKIPVPEEDRSLTIVSTTGKWREVEALKSRIIRMLDRDPDLKLTDIGILAPDINEYAHFIEALFPSEDNVSIPFNIIDLNSDGDSPFVSGFLGLLNLAGSRFTRKELFSLFSNRCFAGKQGISTVEYNSWLTLCDQVNIKWAVDEAHKKELNVAGGRFNSWERGFDRLLDGIALSEDEDPYAAPFELFNESDARSAGKMMHIIRSLHSDINTLTGVRLRLEEWVLIWETIMDSYLKPSDDAGRDERDRLRLKGCFRDILNMIKELNNLEDQKNRLFDFFMFKSLLTEFIQKSGGSRGRYLTQGVSCASLKPLRAVPFKVIMVLGLNEESFPAADEAISFDLKETEEVKSIISIDLSRRSSDKYSFLEVFLSAEEKVFLFYTGRNNVDNEILQPSSLISELGGYINDHFYKEGKDDCFLSLVEEEKLQPFDRVYFSEDSNLFSYSSRNYHLAQVYYGDDTSSVETQVSMDPVSVDLDSSVLEITIGDLIAFLKNPLRYFFNRTCGIYMDETVLLEEDSEENVDPDFFLERSFYRELLLAPELEYDLELFCRLQSARGEIIDNELSIPAVDKIRDSVSKIVKNSKDDRLLSSKPEPLILSFGDETDLSKGVIEAPSFDIEEGLRIKLTGSVPPIYLYPDKTLASIDFLSSSQPAATHWVSSFLISHLLPPGLQKEKGLQSLLVSKDKIHTLQFNSDSNRRSLHELIEVYWKNLQRPVPLYPELADKMIDKKEPLKEWASGEFYSLFVKRWMEKENESYSASYSEFKSCPYRSKAYKSELPVDENSLKILFNSYYAELQKLINKGREK